MVIRFATSMTTADAENLTTQAAAK